MLVEVVVRSVVARWPPARGAAGVVTSGAGVVIVPPAGAGMVITAFATAVAGVVSTTRARTRGGTAA